MDILPENETTTFEEQIYKNPQVGLDEANTFIDNYRAIQGQNTAEIARDTHNLGTDVPSNLGGLTGGEGYFTSRYQTPQAISAIADLRATAQARALSDVLANQQAAYQERYQQAYRRARKRAAARARAATLSGGGGTQKQTVAGGIDYEDTGGGGIGLDEASLQGTRESIQSMNKALSNAETEAHNEAVNRVLRDGTTYSWGTTLLDHIEAGKAKPKGIGSTM